MVFHNFSSPLQPPLAKQKQRKVEGFVKHAKWPLPPPVLVIYLNFSAKNSTYEWKWSAQCKVSEKQSKKWKHLTAKWGKKVGVVKEILADFRNNNKLQL